LQNLAKTSELTIRSLEDKISTQVDMIDTLRRNEGGASTELMEKMLVEATDKMERMAAAMGNSDAVVDPNRPQMEEVFVDPVELDANALEHKIIVEDVSPRKKEDMRSKVDKLKGLMGKLPTKPV